APGIAADGPHGGAVGARGDREHRIALQCAVARQRADAGVLREAEILPASGGGLPDEVAVARRDPADVRAVDERRDREQRPDLAVGATCRRGGDRGALDRLRAVRERLAAVLADEDDAAPGGDRTAIREAGDDAKVGAAWCRVLGQRRA